MSREILFRAKRVDNGEWVYGFVVEAMDVNDEKKSYIIESPANYYRYGEFATVFEVIPDTICEFTGLKDKNGKDIAKHNRVLFAGDEYCVVYEKGAFGLASDKSIDYFHIYDLMEAEGVTHGWEGLDNDNFISLWEIYWSFDCTEDCIPQIEVTGTIFDKEKGND